MQRPGLSSSTICHIIFWDSTSHWSWRSLTWLDWLAVSSGHSCLHLSVPRLQTSITGPWFFVVSGNLKSRPHSCTARTSFPSPLCSPKSGFSQSFSALYILWFCQTSNTKHWLIILDRTESNNFLPLYSKPISLIHCSLSQAFKYLAITDFLTFFIILSLLECSILGIIWLKSSSIFRSASIVG